MTGAELWELLDERRRQKIEAEFWGDNGTDFLSEIEEYLRTPVSPSHYPAEISYKLLRRWIAFRDRACVKLQQRGLIRQ